MKMHVNNLHVLALSGFASHIFVVSYLFWYLKGDEALKF